MYTLEQTEEIVSLLNKTKSNSGVSGPELAIAHIELGRALGQVLSRQIDSTDTTVVAIMRGGLFFAEGIYFELGCKFMTFDPKHEEFKCPDSGTIILVDSVVNTGTTIKKILKPGMLIACCVANEATAVEFSDVLFSARISTNSYVGANVKRQSGKVGPDTTMRLFNEL